VETSATRSSLGLPESAPILLNVGRQTAQKGHTFLIEAFQRVKSEIDAHLVIVGRRGDGSAELEKSIRLHDLESSVTVVPFTPRPVDYYLTADVFVFTSLMEGLGTAVLEAMACGLPIAAFDIPPVREATRNGELAHLTPPGDPDAIAAAVLSVISGQAEDHVEEARTWVVENHSISEIAHQLEGRLIELAENGSINL
jgi:glycosyltransferase involved in cell wall biosynthesis